jgi:excisionase family DNA binding protein
MSNIAQKQERRALSVQETAEACGLSRATIYRLIEQKKLATLKIGARRLVRPEAIEALLNGGAGQ